MKRDTTAAGVPEDIIMELLHCLPSKSLARFKCVSKLWRNYTVHCRYRRWMPQPYLIGFFYQAPETLPVPSEIGFFFSSSEKEVIDGSLEYESLDKFRDMSVYIAASSNGFLLCNMERVYYFVYNPATSQRLALPETQIYMVEPAVGFICKVDDPDTDIISFNIVRYAITSGLKSTVTIESFSSETNVWTSYNLILGVPLGLKCFGYMKSSSACVIDGVFCWLDAKPQITVYDSVQKCFWALQLPDDMVIGGISYLGLSGGALYFALNNKYEVVITVWCLESNIRSRDAIWVKKYAANVGSTVLRSDAFGLARYSTPEVYKMAIHPVVPHIFYLDMRGKFICYDFETDIAELVHDFGEPLGSTSYNRLFYYQWHPWPRVLQTIK